MVPTIKVKTTGFDEPIIINESDFDPDVHEKVEEDSASEPDTLPEDFPGAAALAAAGITTYSQLREVEDLTGISGIGDATAAKIEAALQE